jgi:hypothetical protein
LTVTRNTTVCAGAYNLLGGAGNDLIKVIAVNCPITIDGGDDEDTTIIAPDRTLPDNLITVPVYMDGGHGADTTYVSTSAFFLYFLCFPLRLFFFSFFLIH